MLKYYSPRYQQLRPQPYIMDRLEMLTAREQLMEDIDCIVSGYFDDHYNMDDDYRPEKDELVRILCDVVCKNFPV